MEKTRKYSDVMRPYGVILIGREARKDLICRM